MSSAYLTNDPDQMRIFNERIVRVKERLAVSQAEAQKARHRRKRRGGRGGMASNLLAVSSGAIAVMAARLIRATMFDAELTGSDAATAMVNDAILAVAVALLVKVLFRLNLTQFAVLQSIGIAAMLLGMHNLVHLAPDLFAQVFPDQWVQQVIATTAPNSLLIQGSSIQF